MVVILIVMAAAKFKVKDLHALTGIVPRLMLLAR